MTVFLIMNTGTRQYEEFTEVYEVVATRDLAEKRVSALKRMYRNSDYEKVGSNNFYIDEQEVYGPEQYNDDGELKDV